MKRLFPLLNNTDRKEGNKKENAGKTSKGKRKGIADLIKDGYLNYSVSRRF